MLCQELALGELRKIGNFELIEKVGQGGMGSVFKARQISMDRIVALKILPPSLAKQSKFIERFMREARASARLNHPNVVVGIDYGQDNGIYYFAMEFVEGCSLKDLVKREKISEERTLKVGKAIALALSHAHSLGIIHRDVKPDNILIDGQGVPKLCDLGLARVDSETEEQKALTQQGQAIGTPHYISPEQARGERNLDATTDLYSLGATLYHALCGVTMFTGTTSVVIMTAHITDKAAHPSECGVTLSKGTLAILSKLLTKDRADRYVSADFLAEDIDRVLKGKPPIHAELAAGKSPFKSVAATATSVKKTTGPVAPIMDTEGVAERARLHREAMRKGSGLIRKLAFVALILVAAIAAAIHFSKAKTPQVAVGAATKKELMPAANVKPAGADTKPAAPRVLPPVVAPAPIAKAGAKNMAKKPDVIPAIEADNTDLKPDKPKVPESAVAALPDGAAVATVETKAVPAIVVPEPDPAKVTPPEAVAIKKKETVGPETAALISKALALANESRFGEAADLFKLPASSLEKLDDIDRDAVALRAEGYNGLVEMKQTVLDRLKRDPEKVESDRVFLTKRLGGKMAGGDDKNLRIKQAKQFEVSYKWQMLSIQELSNLVEQSVGTVPIKTATSLGMFAYDRGEDTLARKLLEAVARANPSAQKMLAQIEARDQLAILKRLIENNATAEKLMSDIEIALTELKFPTVLTKANLLKARYAETEAVKARAADIETWIEIGKLAQTGGGLIQVGNVALSTNGTTVTGPTRAPLELIDGITTGYTGGTGFAMGSFPCEWNVTLTKPYILRELRMLLWDMEINRFYRYQIETSSDGKTFSMLTDNSKGQPRSWQTINFAPRVVKAIRIQGLYNSVNGGFHVVELEAYCIPPDQPAKSKYPRTPAE